MAIPEQDPMLELPVRAALPAAFYEVALMDPEYAALVDEVSAMKTTEGEWRQVTGGVPSEFLEKKMQSEERLRSREDYLGDLWGEARGDPQAFSPLIRLRNIQAAVEENPQDPILRQRWRRAKLRYNARRFGTAITKGMVRSRPQHTQSV